MSVSLYFSALFLGMKTMPVLFFSSEGAEYFSFAFSLFLCAPSFFQAPLMCLWIRYHSVWMSSQTQMRGRSHALAHTPRVHTLSLCLFILETRGIRIQACILLCLSVFSMRHSTHITAHTILKYSAYMKIIFAWAIRVYTQCALTLMCTLVLTVCKC